MSRCQRAALSLFCYISALVFPLLCEIDRHTLESRLNKKIGARRGLELRACPLVWGFQERIPMRKIRQGKHLRHRANGT